MTEVDFKRNLSNMQKRILIACIVALASQLYIRFSVSEIRVSVALIILPISLFLFEELGCIRTGFLSVLFIYVFRFLIYLLTNIFSFEEFIKLIYNYSPEIITYVVYILVFYSLSFLNKERNINKLFFILIFSDFLSNILEISIREFANISELDLKIFGSFFSVAFIRSIMAWIILAVLKQYKLLLLKKEHEERYKKLLWMTSRLKSEMYWMEKSMDSIEQVMVDAYELFDKIIAEENKEAWGKDTLSIAKNIHEIKKEYGLVVRGVEEITENKFNDEGTYFYDIYDILKETFENDLVSKGKDIFLDFHRGNNFYTRQHYFLMSIFRNLIMNGVEALEDNGMIKFEHIEIDDSELGQAHEFRIADNGKGIKKAYIERIFSPGFSTKIDYSTGSVNRGLGLSIVRELVEEKLKGRIEVYSTENEGTEFRVFLTKKSLEENNSENINN